MPKGARSVPSCTMFDPKTFRVPPAESGSGREPEPAMRTEPAPGANVTGAPEVIVAFAFASSVTAAPWIAATLLPSSDEPTPNPGGSVAEASVTAVLPVELLATLIFGS